MNKFVTVLINVLIAAQDAIRKGLVHLQHDPSNGLVIEQHPVMSVFNTSIYNNERGMMCIHTDDGGQSWTVYINSTKETKLYPRGEYFREALDVYGEGTYDHIFTHWQELDNAIYIPDKLS